MDIPKPPDHLTQTEPTTPDPTGLRFELDQDQIRAYLHKMADRNRRAAKAWQDAVDNEEYVQLAIERSHRIGLVKARASGMTAPKRLTAQQVRDAMVNNAKDNLRAAEHIDIMAANVAPGTTRFTMKQIVDLCADNWEMISPPEPTDEDRAALEKVRAELASNAANPSLALRWGASGRLSGAPLALSRTGWRPCARRRRPRPPSSPRGPRRGALRRSGGRPRCGSCPPGRAACA